jgi:diacylglycerol kinase family enzyme
VSSVVVVTNARSRDNRRDPSVGGRLAAVLGDQGAVRSPATLEELATTVRELQRDPPRRLAIHGGDGTLHRVLTAWLTAGGAPLPEIVVLRGGTMNIVADSIGVKRSAEQFLGDLAGPVGHTVRTLLELEIDGERVWGFLSGNGIVARFLEKYYERPDPTPLDAARLLGRGALSAFVGGELIRELTRPWVGSVTVDGAPLGGVRPWTAVAVGSVEQLGLRFRVFHHLRPGDDAFHVVALSGSVVDLARELPRLWAGRGVRRPGNTDHRVRELVLEGAESMALMVDGDFYRAASGRVRIVPGPPVRFVVPARQSGAA